MTQIGYCWLLLVDGQAFPGHDDQKHGMARTLSENGFGKPGRSGLFGCMVGSHSLVHEIGGEDDTNANTTRRVLLLLESFAIGDPQPYERVRSQILNRYIGDDRGLTHRSRALNVPRFLLNDFTRYWRTVTVDFVYKQRTDADAKWALRNAKLRMSRKLAFASGLLRCFYCHFDAETALTEEPGPARVTTLLSYLKDQFNQTPLQVLARAASRPQVLRETARTLFDTYDSFLAILDNETKRTELKELRPDQLSSSSTWTEISTISSDFHAALIELFFGSDTDLRMLSTTYGLF